MRPKLLSYGNHHAQVAEVWRVDEQVRPVVVLLHGGYWRQMYTKRLMHGMARAIAAKGWVAYNVEYRRVGTFGSGGWPTTFDDVSAALNALDGVANVDLTRVVTCGHSAGGHLALWLATNRRTSSTESAGAHPVSVRAAISLAGVVDLVVASRLGLGGGAADALIGGPPSSHPERFELGSPAALLPLRIPQVLLHGLADTTVPPSMSEDYVRRACAAGDDAVYLPLEGASHMDMIRPRGSTFEAVSGYLDGIGQAGPADPADLR